jgi:acyl carrier protein phosphodiesterase
VNYLAHIHLAHLTQTSMLGNFLGDFVKGSDLSHLTFEIQQGIKLHRSIDTFTDSHEQVLYLKQRFPRSIRRMSGVVIDIYFDHLLCRYWHQFTDLSMDIVLPKFYAELASYRLKVEGRYKAVEKSLLQHRWLADYAKRDTCMRAFYQIEKRLHHRISFAAQASQHLNAHHNEIEEKFFSFYPDLIKHAKAY